MASQGKGRKPRPNRPRYKWDVVVLLAGRETRGTVSGYCLGNARYKARQRFPGCVVLSVAQRPPEEGPAA